MGVTCNVLQPAGRVFGVEGRMCNLCLRLLATAAYKDKNLKGGC